MEIKYDPKMDTLYLLLVKGKYKASRKVSDNVVVDFDKKNKILGIEILAVKDTIPSFLPRQNEVKIKIPNSLYPKNLQRKDYCWA